MSTDMKKQLLLLFAFWLIVAGYASAQNLLSNGDFENYSILPDAYG